MSRWGHCVTLLCSRYVTAKWDDKTHQPNYIGESLVYIIRCWIRQRVLGWGNCICVSFGQPFAIAAIEGKTPMKMWTNKPATNYDSINVFGSTIYYHVKESKLNPRAKKTLFMGITGGVKGYRLWCPLTKKIIFDKDVTFDESAILK